MGKTSYGEYCDLDDDEEEEIYDSSEVYDDRTEDGKVSWILYKGWGIGKKLLVTGAVISSAPFVLPPLVVTSAIAFACCVPSGVVLASYACSEKLMSKLLPYSGSSEGVLMSNEEEEEEFEDAGEGVDGFGMEGWRDEYLVDENAVGDGVDAFDEFNVIEGEGDMEEFGVALSEVTSVVVLEGSDGQVRDFVEEGELVTETKGLLERIRDEGKYAGSGMEMDEQNVEGIEGSRSDDIDDLVDNNVVSDEVQVFVSNVTEGDEEIVIDEIEGKEIVYGEEELVTGTRGLVEKIEDEGNTDNAVALEGPVASSVREPELASYDKATDVGSEKQIGTVEYGVQKESEDTEEMNQMRHATVVSEDGGLESENADKSKDAEMPIGEIKILNHTLKAEKPITAMKVGVAVVSTIVEETLAPVMNKEARRRARRGKNNIKQGKFQLIKEKEEVSSENFDAREIADESRLYMFDEKNGQQDNTSVSEGLEERSVSSGTKESNDGSISSAKDDLHSKGVLRNEDKIWEQIHAMQSIVGYTGTPHASCIEELKALYIFTGVEPPTSLNDPHDLAQVNDKIRFLKSIIGVK